MSGLLILIPAFPWVNPNLDALLPALQVSGIGHTLAAMDSLRLAHGNVQAADARGQFVDVADHDLVWVLGFGSRSNFLDKLQLLKLAGDRVVFVNTADTFVYLHAKYHLSDYHGALRHPETYASHDAVWLRKRLNDGAMWIAKPPASSFGRGVFKLTDKDENAAAILAQLTDHGRGTYCLLQRYVPQVEDGEKRVLIAGGHVIGAYLRRPNAAGITNLAAGGSAEICQLSTVEASACVELAATLARRGVNYAGIDLVYPWLIEINVANPGGLATLVELGDARAPQRLAERLWVLLRGK